MINDGGFFALIEAKADVNHWSVTTCTAAGPIWIAYSMHC